MDKRKVAEVFRERLSMLIDRRHETVSAFARRCNLDRSALSQFLDRDAVRLPRAETLTAIATRESVSIDWLLGITQDEASFGEVASQLNIETGEHGSGDSLLAEWHREAAGYKIRYVPTYLPDLLVTQAVTDYLFLDRDIEYAGVRRDQARQQLDYSRLPETEMEAILPIQRLQNLAEGADIWGGLQRGVRQAQIEHMIQLIEELYPTFRLFLYDGLKHFCAPFTVFGPKRAAVYLGESYLVVNSVEHIRELSHRFDSMIRVSDIGPDRVADWLRGLKVG